MIRGRKRTAAARTCQLLFSCTYTEPRGVHFGFRLAVGREPNARLSVNVWGRRGFVFSLSIGMLGPVRAEPVRSIPYTSRNNGV
ncbi:hypothetical protein sS8_4150 [Methylocaldum marinum]|uniref:Uncharacterized protein n=1 Tax=Methylocaldum marinum TaxID=1432792 RepID=A0A250KWP8_9GAMM|nr:hypothetical protein sS8_4150 [Methylocaldum marinum]